MGSILHFRFTPVARILTSKPVPSTNLTFTSREQHLQWLQTQSALPQGFRVGTATFDFTPKEAPKPARMTLTLITLDKATKNFAAVFTRNALPGAPVIIGRQRLNEPRCGAIVINNKISNVCAPGGQASAERVCDGTARLLRIPASEVLPSSTGVIGWTLPVEAILEALPKATAALKNKSILPAAEGIMTTDLYPKIRRAARGGGSIVGIAKGAGMVEPNLATMLVYLLTDLDIPRDQLRAMLSRVVGPSFNSISIDSDTSTSDTVALLSSSQTPCRDLAAFEAALATVCADLAEDVVRNGEGVRHVMRAIVTGAPDNRTARSLGKAVVNAPLFKCAVAGNDANVGRLVQAIGKYTGSTTPPIDLASLHLKMGGISIFADGVFQLNPEKEASLAAHLRDAELYQSEPDANGNYLPPVGYPTHERCVDIEIDLGLGNANATILGGDLTHEYITENADYRS